MSALSSPEETEAPLVERCSVSPAPPSPVPTEDAVRNAEVLKLIRTFFRMPLRSDSEEDFFALGRHIVRTLRKYMNCDRASLLIADTESGIFKPTFWDWNGLEVPAIQKLHEAEIRELALPLRKGIAGDALSKNAIQVCDDAQEDPRFFKEVDIRFQYKIRSIMSVPLGSVAVLNLYNKLCPDTGDILIFSADDREVIGTFRDLLGVLLERAVLQRQVAQTEMKLKITLDVLSYRIGVSDALIASFIKDWTPYVEQDPHPIDDYAWDPQHRDDDECVAAFVRMVYSLGYVEKFKISHEKLVRFGLTVARNYREKSDVQYHNLGHATAVTHGMYMLAKRYGLRKLFKDDLEVFSLVLACFCHDLDHRGLSNAYLKTTNSFLSGYFSHSIMEEHHANFAVSILTAPDCDILENLSVEDFKHVLHMTRANIISTDLSVFFSRKAQLTELITTGTLDIDHDKPQRRMIRGLLMNCCDLMAMTKPFLTVIRVVDVIFKEFFTEGDKTKSQGLAPSSELMDRDKEHAIPKMQVGFMSGVVIPAYELMASPNVLPRTEELVRLAKRTLAKWQRWIETDAGYTLGCGVPWEGEEEDEAREAEEVARHWAELDEEDEQDLISERERQRRATAERRHSIALLTSDALKRTFSKNKGSRRPPGFGNLAIPATTGPGSPTYRSPPADSLKP
ncbi:hypothetical protein DFJ74DRAFT_652228 [Hyaloraphidium curvatum]|nr:hypothetical protein DFJ74DRAFT_652228 [Hyaloraphidium curvatum]